MAQERETVLVIGATGMLGAAVARQLKADGFAVRILSRSPERAAALFGPGYEIRAGDVEAPATLDAALAGCAGVHINLKGGPAPEDYERVEHRGTAAVAAAAARAGARQLTYLSGYTIRAGNALSPESRAKWAAEEAIRRSGVPYVIFRATWFMESLPLFVRGSRRGPARGWLIGRQPHPLHWVAAADYARMVARSYREPAALNKELYVFGPEALPMGEALRVYAGSRRERLAVGTLPLWLLRGLGVFSGELRGLAELMGYYDRMAEQGDPAEADRLLGRPATTLAAWCAAGDALGGGALLAESAAAG